MEYTIVMSTDDVLFTIVMSTDDVLFQFMISVSLSFLGQPLYMFLSSSYFSLHYEK